MSTPMPDRPPWGTRLRDCRQQAGLTQGQFIERLSLLISDIDADDRSALERIDVLDEAACYFSGVLDSPTLSRLEKGNRALNSRPRCVALIWGLNRLGVLTDKDEANSFLELAGHGNLTDAESAVVLGPFDDSGARSFADPDSAKEAGSRSGEMHDEHGLWTNRRSLTIGHTLVAMAALILAAATGWAVRDGRDEAGSVSDSSLPVKQSHVLLVDELQSAVGSLGNDQTHTSLHEMDQRSDSDDWTRFVKFLPDDTGSYVGYRAYHLPDHIPVESITRFRLDVNYRGPDYEAAPWVWEVERTDEKKRIRLGDNRDSQWWSGWSEVSFEFPIDEVEFDASSYVRNGEVWISLTGNFATDTFDIDYEALVVEWTDAVSD